jgi:hypothetical protein
MRLVYFARLILVTTLSRANIAFWIAEMRDLIAP